MLKIENLHKSYGKFEVLKGINLHIKPKEIKALVGVNGSGKSTLIETICKIKKANEGQVFINNIDFRDKKNKNTFKKSIGYMPQSFGMFLDLTVKENLEYMRTIYNLDKQRIDEVIELCSLTGYENKLAGNLSGGYKQLLSCASAIIHKPQLLILDEPTSAMDPIFRKRFWKIIEKVKKEGSTILIITHFLEELLYCDTFACIENGKIIHDGPVKDFLKGGFVDINQILKIYTTSDGEL